MRLTQLDRGTDRAAIRVRRSTAVVWFLTGGLAMLVDLVVAWALLSILVSAWWIVAGIWLFLRPRTSPLEPDLHEAVQYGDVELAQRLLVERGADAQAVRWDRSVLDRALANADVDMARLLVAYGADLGGRLHEAAARGDLAMAKLLLAVGADPAARDEQGRSPAQVAAANGHRWPL